MEKTKRWILDIDEQGVVILPDDLLEQTGWQVGDTLKYTQDGDAWIITKVDNEVTPEEEEAWRELEKKNERN